MAKNSNKSYQGRGNRKTLLFLSPDRFALDRRIKNDKFSYFSLYYQCHIVTPVNKATKELTGLKPKSIESHVEIHPFRYYYGNSVLRNILMFYYHITKTLRLYLIHKCRFDVIISPNPLITGLTALFLGKYTFSKVLVEVNGNFEHSFKYGGKERNQLGLTYKIKSIISKRLIRFVLKRADTVKIVYTDQINFLGHMTRSKVRTISFPNFVPISKFLAARKSDGMYILLVGYPWHLKGVDILIKAFNLISCEFPNYRLKIVGWCPEGKEYYRTLANGNPKIELLDPVYYDEVVSLMANCSLYVLASRTDASPRVLREAMACGKPIIASRVDGVPELIKDGYNGLLFEKENYEELANKMRMVLSDKKLALRLGDNGLKYVQENLSEECYIKQYREMIEETLS